MFVSSTDKAVMPVNAMGMTKGPHGRLPKPRVGS
ncbi:hypothetical protein DSL92_06330 [Billgrantia gudaonensis]|uniref:Polysaccharide biosynthesis protein CapD-like domain-containing protein n=1 Tax=Billgrantia gudaonensis TaxID=376427 RepID=A0A3S0VSQ5_9GAMM|nr:hypothetical protein DSL92_06330 [Halomonas gudaonensis]